MLTLKLREEVGKNTKLVHQSRRTLKISYLSKGQNPHTLHTNKLDKLDKLETQGQLEFEHKCETTIETGLYNRLVCWTV